MSTATLQTVDIADLLQGNIAAGRHAIITDGDQVWHGLNLKRVTSHVTCFYHFEYERLFYGGKNKQWRFASGCNHKLAISDRLGGLPVIDDEDNIVFNVDNKQVRLLPVGAQPDFTPSAENLAARNEGRGLNGCRARILPKIGGWIIGEISSFEVNASEVTFSLAWSANHKPNKSWVMVSEPSPIVLARNELTEVTYLGKEVSFVTPKGSVFQIELDPVDDFDPAHLFPPP
ncbi:hypothetical protein CL634_11155 [bacterium]|nr:hypothetical protein [bacterium]